MTAPGIVTDKMGKPYDIAVENIMIIHTINPPARSLDGKIPIEMIEVAVINSHRSIRLRAGATYSDGPAIPVNSAGPAPESDPGKSKRLGGIHSHGYNARSGATSCRIVQNNCCIGDCRTARRAGNSRSALQRNTLCNF